MTLEARRRALEARFRHIHRTRMADVPVCHPGLQVAAVGFAPDADARGALGVLVTPWFMNLVWLPLRDEAPALAVGSRRVRQVGAEAFEFIGACEDDVGAFEACSLFSPMNDFADQAAALATAQAALDHLRRPPAAASAPRPEPVAPRPEPVVALPPRRAFLLGAGRAER